jgi:hypothetical protein
MRCVAHMGGCDSNNKRIVNNKMIIKIIRAK